MIYPNYNQIILVSKKKNSKKNKKEKKIFNYSLTFYCALPWFTGSGLPSDVLQRLAPQTTSLVADP